jgi:hypothetical protein
MKGGRRGRRDRQPERRAAPAHAGTQPGYRIVQLGRGDYYYD